MKSRKFTTVADDEDQAVQKVSRYFQEGTGFVAKWVTWAGDDGEAFYEVTFDFPEGVPFIPKTSPKPQY